MDDAELRRLLILRGDESNSFVTRVTSLQMRAEELVAEAATEPAVDNEAPAAESEAVDENDVAEPVTRQP